MISALCSRRSNEIFKQYNKPVWSAEEFREKFYLPFTDFYKEYLHELPLPELDHHYHHRVQAPADRHRHAAARSGVPRLPPRARACQRSSLSTIHHEHFETQGARLNVKQYFRQAYTQALDKRKVILHLLAEHNLNADETIFIGDMVHDIETARHAGVVSCAVLTGYDSLRKLKGSNPDLLFRNLREVRDFLDRHRGVAAHPPVATVGALIFNTQGEVLMIRTHKWSHKWGIPGGKIKPNEPSEDALRREVLEETGLKLRDIHFELVQDCIEPPEFYKKAHFLLLNYTATAEGIAVQLNDEAEEHRWLSMDDAAKLDLNGPTRVLLDYVRSHPHR